MKFDAIVIGAGLAGLSAASLLAKSGLRVAVIEQCDKPGGSCGIFKRKEAIFDQGSAMLYGFGEKGFNSHRFLFNCLEEPIQMVKHQLLYTVQYKGQRIPFSSNIDEFIFQLSQVFPEQKENIRKFYKEMETLYDHVMAQAPSYTTPDQTNPKEALKGLIKHPLSYIKFLSYMNISAQQLLKKYFTDPEIFDFFDKLTSTYCYATVAEAPAIMASVMFIDNHVGGSYYPAGSTLFLPGKLEKSIEEHNGEFFYQQQATEILFEKEKAVGVKLSNEKFLFGDFIIHSGTVQNLYQSLIPTQIDAQAEKTWANQLKMTYPSVVLYALVNQKAIPCDTCPIEMLVADPKKIDENEVTVYIFSLDDKTICPANTHVVMAIGPSFKKWDKEKGKLYQTQKQEEISRLLSVLEKRFPSFQDNLLHCELASPLTLEKFAMKYQGSVAGPKQMLGQHMFKRQKIQTKWKGLYCCGEATPLGTGTPTVTTSGIAAANAVLKQCKKPLYLWQENRKNYVDLLPRPILSNWMDNFYPAKDVAMMQQASKCYYCNSPSCYDKAIGNVSGIMRRVACGNFIGAKKELDKFEKYIDLQQFADTCAKNCIRNKQNLSSIQFYDIFSYLKAQE